MESRKLFIIRHGETDYNKLNLVQGRGIDAPLNETGRIQSEAFYRAYKEYPFEKIYTSSLKRTGETVIKFIEKGIPSEKLADLDEISWGDQEGAEFTPEAVSAYKETVRRWRLGELHLSVSGGETPVDVMERQKKAIDYIIRQPEKEVLICMHGRAMRILLSWVLNYDLKHMDDFGHQNLCLYQLTHLGSTFRVDRFNDTEHLVLDS